MSKTAVIIGATRGLGNSLAKRYLSKGFTVYGTARKLTKEDEDTLKVKWIPHVDIGTATAAEAVVKGYKEQAPIDILYVSAGFFGKESFEKPDWNAQETMYKTSAIGPVFLVSGLVKAGLLKQGSKVIMVSSESGSITLRHGPDGGGDFGHHASKAALNMVTKLLSLDVEDKGIAVVSVHPGFMRTEMTKSVGFDKHWDDGGAVTPDEAAESLAEWVDNSFDIGKTGQYWAPRGAADIGTAEKVLGPIETLPTPLELPW